MKIYFIRHGQSVANNTKNHSGWSQTPLSEQGKEDAQRVGRVLSEIEFDKVYSSDLIRAMETCEIALGGADYEALSILREVNVGMLAGRSFDACLEEYGEEYAEHRKRFEFKNYGGESYEDYCIRVKKFLDVAEKSGYENIAAFCHGGFINTALDVISGVRTDRACFPCHNCSVSVFELKDGKWRVLLWNYMGEI